MKIGDNMKKFILRINDNKFNFIDRRNKNGRTRKSSRYM